MSTGAAQAAPSQRGARSGLLAPEVTAERRADGSVLLRSRATLSAHADSPLDWLREHAERTPQRIWLHADGRTLDYGSAASRVRRLAAGLLERGLDPQRPVLVVARNGIEHALIALAAMAAGGAIAPVTPQWLASDAGAARLAAVAELLNPQFVFADAALTDHPALRALAARGAMLHAMEALEAVEGPAATRPLPRPGRSHTARVMLTSGSTGTPKAVILTHGIMSANVQAVLDLWPFIARQIPEWVDWLPWHHTFGGNNNVNLVLRLGGTLHVDRGAPRPDGLGPTLEHLRAVAPTLYFNVPAGFAALAPHLESDAALRRNFFSRLDALFYAGAALPRDLGERYRALAAAERGRDAPPPAWLSGWGSTETGPSATLVVRDPEDFADVGVPVPGATVKLAPVNDKLELRVKGPAVTPGYFGRPDLTAAAFDEEGYYRTGDAGRFADPARPERGLRFDGRIAEDFKLATGSWVNAGVLRLDLLAAARGALREAVILGPDRPYAAALVWLDPALPREEALARLREAAASLGGGASRALRRIAVLETPPSPEAGEVNEKGTINQRVARERRAADAERLYADPPADDLITP